MNCSKSTHFLLIAALFFSQFAASVHVTSHLQEHKHEHHGLQSAISPAGTLRFAEVVLEASADTAKHFYVSAAHADEHAQDHHGEKVDCEIFHLLLNLSGGFLVTQNDLGATLQLSLVHSFASSIVARGALNRYRIRAPPEIS